MLINHIKITINNSINVITTTTYYWLNQWEIINIQINIKITPMIRTNNSIEWMNEWMNEFPKKTKIMKMMNTIKTIMKTMMNSRRRADDLSVCLFVCLSVATCQRGNVSVPLQSSRLINTHLFSIFFFSFFFLSLSSPCRTI